MRLYSVLALALVACGGTNGGGGDDVAPGVDAPDGMGCADNSPRSVAPETFVGPTGLQPRLESLIDSAQHTLDVQMYLFTVSGIADRVVAAHQRGVAVRVLLDPDEAGNMQVRPTFTAAGVPMRDAPALYSFSHAKYLVIDGATSVIMSMNFNIDAMNNERNYGMVDKDPKDVTDVQAIFNMDWAAAGGEPVMAADLSCTRLIVSPNNSKLRLLALIDGAKSTLDVEALYVTEQSVRDAIAAAKSRGVTVRVILEGSSDSAGNIPYFKSLGIEVHEPSSFFLHAKLIIADGVVFVGSENYSQTSLTKNREVGALVFEPGATTAVQTQFDSDWNTTPLAP